MVEWKLCIVIVVIIRPRCFHSTVAYSHQTFPWTICRSVRVCVRPSVCPVHCGKTADRIAWHRRLDRSRDEAGNAVSGSVHGKVYFGVNLGCAIVTNEDFTAYMCNSAMTWPSSQITLGKLVIILD